MNVKVVYFTLLKLEQISFLSSWIILPHIRTNHTILPHCTSMHVHFVHCEIIDVEQWNITHR